MTKLMTTSPAYDRSSIEGINSLCELPWCGKLNLRGDPNDSKFLNIIENVLGFSLPLAANTCIAAETRTCFWLGPDEWLIHCDLLDLADLTTQLGLGINGIHHAIVDVSDYYTIIRLDGLDANALLAKACPLDLDVAFSKPNSCVQTRFGHASILVHKLGPAPTYDIQVRWSFTEYVWDYLLSAMKAL